MSLRDVLVRDWDSGMEESFREPPGLGHRSQADHGPQSGQCDVHCPLSTEPEGEEASELRTGPGGGATTELQREVFCKRVKRLSFLNRFYRERAVGISFHKWAFASGQEDFLLTHFSANGR